MMENGKNRSNLVGVLKRSVIGMMSNPNKDVEELREELKDYYGTAMVNGFPLAMLDLQKTWEASDEEIIQMDRKNGMI